MGRIQTNLRNAQAARLTAQLAAGETVSGFTASALLREIARREKGGKVEVLERKAGKPKQPATV